MLLRDLPESLRKQVSTYTNVLGEVVVSDLRPCAGKSAQESGKVFEDVVEHIILNKKMVFSNLGKNISLIKKPKFKCHFGLEREGDFFISCDKYNIHLEAKQLGDVQSHFDKLSHCLLNVISGCYGNHFWLVYDYNRNCKKSAKQKIKSLVERCEEVKNQVKLQGITFELIHIDDLSGHIAKLV